MTKYLIGTLLIILSACGSNPNNLEAKKESLEKKELKLEALKSEIRLLKTEIESLGGDTSKGKSIKLVSAMPVSEEPFDHYIEIQGAAKSEENIALSTDVGGLVKSILIDEGQRVSKGQLLIQLDNAVMLNNIDELKTSLALAETVFKKQENLWKQNIGSEIQFLEAKNNKEGLEKKLQTLYTQLEKTKIKSPIYGQVDKLFVKLGELASPGSPVIRVVNNSQIEIEAAVSEAYLGKVHKGDNVDVHFPVLNKTIRAKVTAEGQIINPDNRTFNITVSIRNKDNLLKPNLLATIKIRDYHQDNAVVVPTKLIHFSRSGKYVYTIDQTSSMPVAKKVMIETGQTYEGKTEVLTGLDRGQLLINDGYREVAPGDELKLNEPPKTELANGQQG